MDFEGSLMGSNLAHSYNGRQVTTIDDFTDEVLLATFDFVSELRHSDHIRKIDLVCYTTSQIEKLWTAMQMPFPELAALHLVFRGPYAPVPPDSFLGGSAPRLRYLHLDSIPFPGLPKLLTSATHLVNLYLCNIPHSGYIPPEAMATCLSMLTCLEALHFRLNSPQSYPDQESRRSTPPTCFVLPTLTIFRFEGDHEYLEAFVARIDTPRLFQLSATFFNDIRFETPELIRFVSRSSNFKALNKAHISFSSRTASVKFQPQLSDTEFLEVNILCRAPDWQLSSVAQICSTFLPLISTTENLFIHEPVDSQLDWGGGIESIEWLELLLPFTTVKNLYLRKQFAPRIAPALQEITGGETTEVLSTLQNLYLEGFQPSESAQGGIEGFISARRLTDRPVAISGWDTRG